MADSSNPDGDLSDEWIWPTKANGLAPPSDCGAWMPYGDVVNYYIEKIFSFLSSKDYLKGCDSAVRPVMVTSRNARWNAASRHTHHTHTHNNNNIIQRRTSITKRLMERLCWAGRLGGSPAVGQRASLLPNADQDRLSRQIYIRTCGSHPPIRRMELKSDTWTYN